MFSLDCVSFISGCACMVCAAWRINEYGVKLLLTPACIGHGVLAGNLSGRVEMAYIIT